MPQKRKEKPKTNNKLLREWLKSTPKRCAPPISFAQFSSLIKNLPDIAFDIQHDKIAGPAMSLDECAQWYYHAFYDKNATSIRAMYNYQLRACPKNVQNKLLQIPAVQSSQRQAQTNKENRKADTVAPSPGDASVSMEQDNSSRVMKIKSTEECNKKDSNADAAEPTKTSASKCRVLVTVGDAGRFLFPVTFAQFERYIKQDDLLVSIVKRQTNNTELRKQMLDNPLTRRQLLRKYYNSFYMSPSTRRVHKFSFKAVPKELRRKLLEFGTPVGETAIQTATAAVTEPEHAETVTVNNNKGDEDMGKCRKGKSKQNIASSIVSFPVFTTHICNLYDIACKLKLSDKDYECMDFDACAFAYYVAFYATPEIRDKYQYKLKSCPMAMKNRILQIPSIEALQALQQQDEQVREVLEFLKVETACAINVKEMEDVEVNLGKNGLFRFPVSFEIFKRYINYDELLVPVMKAVEKDEQKLAKLLNDSSKCEKNFHSYYHSFYVLQHRREAFPYRLNTTNAQLKERLLRFAVPLNDIAKQTICVKTSVGPSESVETKGATVEQDSAADVNDLANNNVVVGSESARITLKGIDYEFPVSFMDFLSCINYCTIKEELVNFYSKTKEQAAETLNNEIECLKLLLCYYHSFYTIPKIRKKFKFNFDRAPPSLRDKLMHFAIPPTELAQTKQSNKTENLQEDARLENVNQAVCPAVDNVESRQNMDAQTQVHTEDLIAPEIREVKSIEACWLSRKAELERMSRTKCVTFSSNHLHNYIASKVENLEKRTFLEQHFLNIAEVQTKAHTLVSTVATTTTVTRTAPGMNSSNPTTTTPRTGRALNSADASKNAAGTMDSTEVTKTTIAPIAEASSSLHSSDIETSTTAASRLNDPAIITTSARTLESPAVIPTTAAARNLQSPAFTITGSQRNLNSLAATTTTETVHSLHSSSHTTTSKTKVVRNLNSTGTTATTRDQRSLVSPETPSTKTTTITARAPNNQQAVDLFFATSGREHNMQYLMCSSQGLKSTIWQLLSQLSLEEFEMYTSIHDVELLYENEDFLRRCYRHAIIDGHWPENLYVKMQMLLRLLHSRGVQISTTDLEQLSPKMFHWCELMVYTNFEEIVELHFFVRTGKDIEDYDSFQKEMEQLYKLCWFHDRWIHQVPAIIEGSLSVERKTVEESQAINGTKRQLVAQRVATAPHPQASLFDTLQTNEDDPNSITYMTQFAHSPDLFPSSCTGAASLPTAEPSSKRPCDELQKSICPDTQLEIHSTPTFVDINDVCTETQLQESQSDPLQLMGTQAALLPPTTPANIKQEPIKFLNNMRFSCNNDRSGEFYCEVISTQELIINLDDHESERIAAELQCFAIPTRDSTVIDVQMNSLMCEEAGLVSATENHQLTNAVTVAEEPKERNRQLMQSPPKQPRDNKNASKPIVPVSRKTKQRAMDVVPTKKPRLMPDNVPQLKHQFRPLPVNAMCRIETQVENKEMPEQPQQPTITVSQALAEDNTFFDSTQLQYVLDAQFLNVPKVNDDVPHMVVSDSTERALPAPQVSISVVCRKLMRYIFIQALTPAHICQYNINSNGVGRMYQEAFIQSAGQRINVCGPLLHTLFPRCTPSLLNDLTCVLHDLGEFNYIAHRQMRMQGTEDLRTRVLHIFMHTAPIFGHFGLKFENESREWASCSVIAPNDPVIIRRKTSCDLVAAIKPAILERIKNLKHLF